RIPIRVSRTGAPPAVLGAVPQINMTTGREAMSYTEGTRGDPRAHHGAHEAHSAPYVEDASGARRATEAARREAEAARRAAEADERRREEELRREAFHRELATEKRRKSRIDFEELWKKVESRLGLSASELDFLTERSERLASQFKRQPEDMMDEVLHSLEEAMMREAIKYKE
ncbi:unnamed protein product, partial [Amoebophrya sp. A120]